MRVRVRRWRADARPRTRYDIDGHRAACLQLLRRKVFILASDVEFAAAVVAVVVTTQRGARADTGAPVATGTGRMRWWIDDGFCFSAKGLDQRFVGVDRREANAAEKTPLTALLVEMLMALVVEPPSVTVVPNER